VVLINTSTLAHRGRWGASTPSQPARALAGTPAYEQSRQGRKRIEMLFAHLKRILKLGRLRLRSPCGAQDEFLLAATTQNLRKLAKLILPTGSHMIQGA
jgi:hypothetical protein